MTHIDFHDQAEIPEELDAALHRAALATPPHAGDLAGILARGRVRRRHRAVAAWGGAVAAVAVAAVLTAPVALPAPSEPAANPPVLAMDQPAQRLLLDGAGHLRDQGDSPDPPEGSAWEQYQFYRQQPGVSGVLGTLAEVRPGGEVVELGLGEVGVDGFHQLLPLPEGKLVGLGYLAPVPGGESADGRCFEEVTLRLLVIEADRTVSDARYVPCGSSLLAADPDTAYLVRDDQLVAHDLATGSEQVLLESPEVLARGTATMRPASLSLAAGRLVRVDSAPGQGECPAGGPAIRVTVAEVPGGDTASYPLDVEDYIEDCLRWVWQVRVSPDGAYAAIAGEIASPEGVPEGTRVVIVDLSGGEVVGEVALGPPAGPDARRGVAGMAWQDDRTVRVAWYRDPDDEVVWLPDVVEVSTFTVP